MPTAQLAATLADLTVLRLPITRSHADIDAIRAELAARQRRATTTDREDACRS